MGNFDYKNICLLIKLKDNLTDPRFLDFMKDWNFSLQESQEFIKSAGLRYHPIAKKIMRFFVEYKDGLLFPDKCGCFEPLKHVFNVDDLSTYISWLTFPAGNIMLKKKQKFSAEIFNESCGLSFEDGMVIPSKWIIPEYPSKIIFWFSKQQKINMNFLQVLLCDFCTYLDTDEGLIFDQENLQVLKDIFHPEREGTFLERY